MTPESLPNAPVGPVCGHVGQILAKAERLCRTIAHRDLGSTPLYLLAQS